MKSRVVLVERENKTQNTVVGCSGLMLEDKYVVVTANVLFDQVQKVFEEIEPRKLYTNLEQYKDVFINVVWKDDEGYVVKKAKIFSAFISSHIKNCNKFIFQNWAVDSIDNNRDINEILSLFFVLALNDDACTEDFNVVLKKWWDVTIEVDINKGDTIYTESVPFANRNFMNTVSKGIVSNIFGSSSCLVLSDCPCTPGSEGGPVYVSNREHVNNDVPVGIILSSVSFWRGEWVGLTVIADIRPIIMELIDTSVKVLNNIPKPENFKIIATLERSLVQIYSGNQWGTAILLDREKGFFITNSHVVGDLKLSLFHKGQSFDAKILYRTPDNDVYDLAIVRSDPEIIKNKLKLGSISISRKKIVTGDTVYAAGHSLFPKECSPSPTLSKGCISHVHPAMIKTTCCVHPGSSGGGILDSDGALLGIIVCNAKLENNNMVYPRMNMAVPFSAICDTIFRFMETADLNTLNDLHVKNKEAEFVWKRLEGKL